MAEVECFGFHIGMNETINRRYEFMKDLKKLQNDKKSDYVGITPTEYGQMLLFITRDGRNNALIEFRGKYQSIRREKRSVYIDEKYLKKGYKPTVEEMAGGDTEFLKMMQEIREDIKKEVRKELEKENKELMKEFQLLKQEINDCIVERNKYKFLAEERGKQLEAERLLHETERKKLNKTILCLESDLKRMEKENMF